MSWELEADIDLAKSEDACDLVMAYLSVFGESVQTLRLKAVEGGWDGTTISKDVFQGVTDFSPSLSKYCRSLLINKNRVEVSVGLAVEFYEQAWPRPAIQLFAPANTGRTTRRRSDAVLTFGNRQAYKGNTRLANGSILTEQFIIDALKSVCKIVSPKSVFLHCEETVSFPIDYHFVYHRSLEGFAEDVAEIVRISIHGGAGYQDGRRNYEAALSDIKGETMMFGTRHGEWLSAIKSFIATKASWLDAVGIPTTFSPEFIADIIAQCTDVEFFHTNDGLGVFGLPLLEGYCEDFYVGIMEQLALETNAEI
jgi:hypothetical protein